jgi:DNA-binding response OmpR family regulator
MPELLIVDDEDALRRWAERTVRENGYTCDGAADAGQARERLAKDEFRLALLDVNLPGESGMRLLSDIRRDKPDVAVVMVTGEDSKELALKAIELGAYGYLVKPVGAGELIINVANALHRWRTETQNQVQACPTGTATPARTPRPHTHDEPHITPSTLARCGR